MTTYILIRYLHFVGIFLIVGTLVAEHLLLKPTHTRSELNRLSRIDAVYGIGAVLVLTAGLLMWFAVGKPAVFYTKNWVFHLKITLFAIVAILSIWPTIFFLKNRKGDPEEAVKIPVHLKVMIRMEMLLVVVIPLLAILMALGVGTF